MTSQIKPDAPTDLVARLAGDPDGAQFVSLERAEARGLVPASRLPATLKILAESVLRRGGHEASELAWLGRPDRAGALSFFPGRLLLQDFTGVPLMTDLASLRTVLAEQGRDPTFVRPVVPVDFVVDHALIAEHGGSPAARARNEALEVERNRERFAFLKWCADSFDNVRILPPGSGIMHQLNLEYVSTVAATERTASGLLVRPDTLIGTDSHTTMVNGLGVLGWGVGGLEAEAVMLGHGTSVVNPRVVGLKLEGRLPAGVTATDLVLHITELMRAAGVTNQFIEAIGSGVAGLSVEVRSTLANMCPEYGATSLLFPVDQQTLRYLELTARSPEAIARVARYAKAQGLWREAGDYGDEQIYDRVISFDLGQVQASLAGPQRPEQRVPLNRAAQSFSAAFPKATKLAGAGIKDGDIVLAAITSCTNTSNPDGMLRAGLVARNAARLGLKPKPWVKTTFAPGSRVVADYLAAAGLQPALDALGFQVVGFGCTTCNGNSGSLPADVARQIEAEGLTGVAVLSGNRNFPGRIHPQVEAAYLASPALVIAYAIAGTINTDLGTVPLGQRPDGRPVMLADIWPTDDEVAAEMKVVTRERFAAGYGAPLSGHTGWQGVVFEPGKTFAWDPASTFISRSKIAPGRTGGPDAANFTRMRPLVILGDKINTDTLSPNGQILPGTPAAAYLTARGVALADLSSNAARRGHHDLAVLGTFANPHLRNAMLPDKRGPFTLVHPEGRVETIPQAAQTYAARGEPVLIIAGSDYGCGSSRDWAAKGVAHLGVRCVLAQSYERIHRANLVAVGVVPLRFSAGQSASSLGLDGSETYSLDVPVSGFRPADALRLTVEGRSGAQTLTVAVMLESEDEARILAAGGLLPVLLSDLMAAS